MFVLGPVWFVALVMIIYIGYHLLRPRTVVTVVSDWAGPAATVWVVYAGTTPPLRLKLSLAGSEAYRQAVAQIAGLTYAMVEQLPDEQQANIYTRATARTFVIDWDMSGKPYDPQVMAQILAADINLTRFVFDEVKRRST